MLRSVVIGLLAVVASGPLRAQSADPPVLPSESRIRAMAADRIADGRVPGLAIGRLAEDGTLAFAAGQAAAGQLATPETLFEIGSITKVFTGLLLADMVLRGEVDLDDPVVNHLPSGSTVPDRDGVAITLRHLASHTSGLPRLPMPFVPVDFDDPYAHFDGSQLTDWLAGHRLASTPGTRYLYSNLGAGLLGYALAHRAGSSYETLVRERILTPLGMDQTVIVPTDRSAGVATGHDAMGEPTAPWTFGALAGAGALRSSLTDMLIFARAALDTTSGPLAPVMALSQREVFRADSTTAIGLGWHHLHRRGRTYVWHNGGTGGFRTMLVLDPGARRAAVVLGNSTHSNDAVGVALLDSTVSVPPLPPLRPTVDVDSAAAMKLVGRYQFNPRMVMQILPREGGRLSAHLPGQFPIRLYASSPTEFFVTEVEASITFELGPDGTPVALVLHQGGRDQRATRETTP